MDGWTEYSNLVLVLMLDTSIGTFAYLACMCVTKFSGRGQTERISAVHPDVGKVETGGSRDGVGSATRQMVDE